MVQLLFPTGLRINMPSGDRIEMFPPATEGRNVVYSIGKDDKDVINFVLKEAAINAYPESFFAMQLTRASDFRSGVEEGDNDEICIRLNQNDALYFPIVFAYLNSGTSSTADSNILSNGLSTSDAESITELTHEYFQIKADHATIVHHLQLQRDFNTQRVMLRANGRLGERQLVKSVVARLDRNGIITATGGDAEVRINLRAVPIAAPWPRSVVGDKVMEMLVAGREYARKQEEVAGKMSLGGIIPGDELGPVPDNDYDMLPYPYPVDMKESFFIPAAAIHYRGRNPFICEGMVDGTRIRIDAVDCTNHAWFWLEIDIRID